MFSDDDPKDEEVSSSSPRAIQRKSSAPPKLIYTDQSERTLNDVIKPCADVEGIGVEFANYPLKKLQ